VGGIVKKAGIPNKRINACQLMSARSPVEISIICGSYATESTSDVSWNTFTTLLQPATYGKSRSCIIPQAVHPLLADCSLL
jgi:hypothetical protein